MEVCESSSKIRRVTPVPEQTQEREIELKSRTVYCKGFPKDRMNIDKLLEFFKDFPTVLNVRVRSIIILMCRNRLGFTLLFYRCDIIRERIKRITLKALLQ